MRLLEVALALVLAFVAAAVVEFATSKGRVERWTEFLSHSARGAAYVVIGFYVLSMMLTAPGFLKFSSASHEGGKLVVTTFSPFHLRKERVASFVVSPVGWQNSHIGVKQGDSVYFSASGKISAGTWQVLQTVQKALEIENRHRASNQPIDDLSTDELNALKLDFGLDWVGPSGYEGKYRSLSSPGRERWLAFHGANYGALIGAITSVPPSPNPPDTATFKIGAGTAMRVPHDGELWFNINDVGFFPDSPTDQMGRWYRDNSGFFSVVITVID